MAKLLIGLLLILALCTLGYLILGVPIERDTPIPAPTSTPMLPIESGTNNVAASTNNNSTDTLVVRYPRVESINDERHSYHIDLLRVALERTTDSYGPFSLEPSVEVMNEIHIMRKLEAGSDDIDVIFRPTSSKDELSLTPVRIPLDKGLLGYRICLIRDDYDGLDNVKTIADLQHIKIGQGRDWGDVLVYQHNKIPIITGAIYEGLFEMLSKKRFDVFPRGIQEAYVEYDDRHELFPNLSVDEQLLIHYPFVRYMWVANSEKGSLLRQRLQSGLESIIADGTFDKMFFKRYGKDIKRGHLEKRRIISIKNPGIPDSVAFDNKKLWFDPIRDIAAEP